MIPCILPFVDVMLFGYGHNFIYAVWDVVADMLVAAFQGCFGKVVSSFITNVPGPILVSSLVWPL